MSSRFRERIVASGRAAIRVLVLVSGLAPVTSAGAGLPPGQLGNATQADAGAIVCTGPHVQGGGAVCRALPETLVQLGEVMTRADRDGFFVVGFDRDAPPTEVARIWLPNGKMIEHGFSIAPRNYSVSRIDGLPASQVDQYSAEELARIEASSARKRRADDSRAEIAAFREPFSWPLEGRKTTPFGSQRILNGVDKRPHYGIDLAAPEGTPIRAPAGGVVSLADDDLYFEGAMIVVDHGQGFASKYLHVSRIDVVPGQRVRRGEVMGAVGSRGRSTGPHLCWRLKWRDRNLDPELWMDGAPAGP